MWLWSHLLEMVQILRGLGKCPKYSLLCEAVWSCVVRMMMNIGAAAAVILQIECKAAGAGSGRRLIPGKEAARSGASQRWWCHLQTLPPDYAQPPAPCHNTLFMTERELMLTFKTHYIWFIWCQSFIASRCLYRHVILSYNIKYQMNEHKKPLAPCFIVNPRIPESG